jgi:hypothetical protein
LPFNYYNYFTEIEDEFVRRRGSPLLISPLDWSLIETWKQRGVPLHVVLRGIHASFDAYDARARRGRKVNSLFYCQQEVEALFLEYCEARVGSNGQSPARDEGRPAASPFSQEALIAYLSERREIIAQLGTAPGVEPPLAETCARAARRLEQIIGDLHAAAVIDPERLEADLTLIEELLLAGLRQSAGADLLEQLRREGDEQLRAYRSGMGPEVYRQTLDNYVARRLREQHRVPRLSLFYL